MSIHSLLRDAVERNDSASLFDIFITTGSAPNWVLYHAAAHGKQDIVLSLLSLIDDVSWGHLFLCSRPYPKLTASLLHEYSKGLRIIRTHMTTKGIKPTSWDTTVITSINF